MWQAVQSATDPAALAYQATARTHLLSIAYYARYRMGFQREHPRDDLNLAADKWFVASLHWVAPTRLLSHWAGRKALCTLQAGLLLLHSVNGNIK